MTGEARAAGRLAVSPPAQTTSEDERLLGAWMPTKSGRDFCFPRLIGEKRALHGAPFIHRTHWQATQRYLGSQSALGDRVTCLFIFSPTCSLSNIFILDLTLLTRTVSKGMSEQRGGRHHRACT